MTNAPGAILPQPSVRVLLYPAEAVAGGAKWSVNGGAWNDSGDVVNVLLGTNTEVSVTVSYRSIYGWTGPTNETFVMTNGQYVTLTRFYQKNGTLTYSLEPVGARLAGAQWSVDGGMNWNDSDATVSNLSPGVQSVIFSDVAGWVTPGVTNVIIPEGGDVFGIAVYEPVIGSVYVLIMPPEAIVSGALWRVDGGPWTNSGTYADVAYGAHLFEFLSIPDWVTPAPQTVTITEVAQIAITGVYSQITGLLVEIEPQEARDAGAAWRLNGGSWSPSGMTQDLAVGTYTVDFLQIPNWVEPMTQQVEVVTNTITRVRATYYQYDIVPTNWSGLFNKPRGIAFDSQRRLHVADSENHRVVIYDTRTGGLAFYGGPVAGTAAGSFNLPLAVALDSSDNLYVAEANNHRIQRRSAQTGTWTVWGGTSAGTGLGQFNTPFDVAVDSRTNLYVADHYNHRVQKRIATNGAWVALATNGFADGQVRFPAGVEVDNLDRVYVTDLPATNNPRVQVFNTNGVYLYRVGGPTAEQGSLGRPFRMDFGYTNYLFVADWGNSSAVRWTGSNAWDVIMWSSILSQPEGVAWDDRGYLYIADTGHNRILRVLVDPLSTNVPPAVAGMLPGPGGMTISWLGALGWFYTLQYTDTGMPPWLDVSGCILIPGIDGMVSCTDTNNMGIPTRIYRIVYY